MIDLNVLKQLYDFEYEGNRYILTELTTPVALGGGSYDIVAIFKIRYCKWNDVDLLEATEEDYDLIKYDFIDYFYGADDDAHELISNAKEYIDRH